jgi:hypothetical protein
VVFCELEGVQAGGEDMGARRKRLECRRTGRRLSSPPPSTPFGSRRSRSRQPPSQELGNGRGGYCHGCPSHGAPATQPTETAHPHGHVGWHGDVEPHGDVAARIGGDRGASAPGYIVCSFLEFSLASNIRIEISGLNSVSCSLCPTVTEGLSVNLSACHGAAAWSGLIMTYVAN